MSRSGTYFGLMRSRDDFESDDQLRSFLARQLAFGRLAISIGAGASLAFGLPTWADLVARAARISGCHIAPTLSNAAATDAILRTLANDELRFAEVVREALYEGYDSSLTRLVRHPLLLALGALCMGSSRGAVRNVVSFNYDDLLERYLDYYGFVVDSIASMPHWQSRADVRIIHPHGLLPSDLAESVTPIVFAQLHYDDVVSDPRNPWRRILIDVFSSHTCLFIGLSGDDQHLSSILREVSRAHPAIRRGDAYWGVRLARDDGRRGIWEDRLVFQRDVVTHEDIPSYLLDLCQRAAAATAGRRGLGPLNPK